MSDYRPGVRVKMSDACKAELMPRSAEHVREFGDQTGTIIGLVWEDTPDVWDVMWDSKLKYMYKEEHLDIIFEH